MAEISIPSGPIHSPPYMAIRTDRLEPSQPANETALREALDGVEWGVYDETILQWLSSWEPATVATVCSWLYRVREAGRD